MQPTFPPDHHFHRRSRAAAPLGTRAARGTPPAAPDFADMVDRALAYLTGQVLPAADPSDPRAGH